ncbi:aminotransferase class IV [Chamaesiphon minutus]|uniref:Branched-chain amino acid aminotransferase/4-amino-4-deoxychorismate lyase n=1 Tax=Chamaesiphon minutus (strain ATCC 27169 / PCC 6605) TaxID=1173020 RepID=K9UN40_CHAP6|nr:aminotransferase class IV [Chamaesiphon minutus]AFY96230.1 branched-chain amino acid aminotransferase/4-amino-4-deoxychorismate lyase [Chamaesiphon minutus PCC 6605]
MGNLYWYCGELIAADTIELKIDDPGLLYGATVFTTFKTATLSTYLYELHCDRLRFSIDDLDWCQPDWAKVRSGVAYLMPHFSILRVTIFFDGRELITGRELPPNLANWQQEGVTAIIADGQLTRSLSQHKTGNYLAPWLALKQARNNNIQEAILINDRGDWLETTTGNLWGYRDGCWYTPPLSAGILPGIARSQILATLIQQNRQVLEIEWTPAWVKDLESIGYSNSVIDFIPIHTVITPVGTLNYAASHPAIAEVRSL